MNIEQQVTSLELAKRLKELGVRQKSVWYWVHPAHDWSSGADYMLYPRGYQFRSTTDIVGEEAGISAFTVAELAEMLPERISVSEDGKRRHAYLHFPEKKFPYYSYKHGGDVFRAQDPSEANARARTLIWLIEDGHVDVKDL